MPRKKALPLGASTSPSNPVPAHEASTPRSSGKRPSTRKGREALPTCGAMTRAGTPCSLAAGFKTQHLGEGRCHLHGGIGQKPSQRYIDLQTPDRLSNMIERFAADPDPLNLLGELATARAILAVEVEDYSAMKHAILAWDASWSGQYQRAINKWRAAMGAWYLAGQQGDPPKPPHPEDLAQKPRQIASLADLTKVIERVANVVEKIIRAQQEGTITMARLDQIIEELGVGVVEAAQEVRLDAVTRTKLLTAIECRWGSISVSGDPGTQTGSGSGRTIN